MGGNLFKKYNIETKRILKEETDKIFINLKKQIENKFNKKGLIELQNVVNEKEDFGDLDIIFNYKILTNKELNDLYEFIKKELACQNLLILNGDAISFPFKYKNKIVHIDLIKTRNELEKYFYYYDPFANIIGKLLSRIGIKWNKNEIYFKTKIKGQYYKIHITENEDFLFFILGLDKEKFLNGFLTYNELFDYIINSTLFNKIYFEDKNLNYSQRKRDTKRKTWKLWKKYLEQNQNIIKNKTKLDIVKYFFFKFNKKDSLFNYIEFLVFLFKFNFLNLKFYYKEKVELLNFIIENLKKEQKFKFSIKKQVNDIRKNIILNRKTRKKINVKIVVEKVYKKNIQQLDKKELAQIRKQIDNFINYYSKEYLIKKSQRKILILYKKFLFENKKL